MTTEKVVSHLNVINWRVTHWGVRFSEKVLSFWKSLFFWFSRHFFHNLSFITHDENNREKVLKDTSLKNISAREGVNVDLGCHHMEQTIAEGKETCLGDLLELLDLVFDLHSPQQDSEKNIFRGRLSLTCNCAARNKSWTLLSARARFKDWKEKTKTCLNLE